MNDNDRTNLGVDRLAARYKSNLTDQAAGRRCRHGKTTVSREMTACALLKQKAREMPRIITCSGCCQLLPCRSRMSSNLKQGSAASGEARARRWPRQKPNHHFISSFPILPSIHKLHHQHSVTLSYNITTQMIHHWLFFPTPQTNMSSSWITRIKYLLSKASPDFWL